MPRPRHLSRPSNGQAPFPTADAVNIGTAGHTPMPRPKHLLGKKPLKSALKKGQSPFGAAIPLPMERPPSNLGQRRVSDPTVTRQRTNSAPRFVPGL